MSVENPPAFPCDAQSDRSVPPEHDWIQTGTYSGKFPGMSLRDWFAGKVLAGASAGITDIDPDDLASFKDEIKALADLAYMFADAMLAARARGDAS